MDRAVLPPCPIVGPSGERVVVHADRRDTVGDLARALGIRPGDAAIDGRAVGAHVRLADSGLAVGSTVGAIGPAADDAGSVAAVEVAVVAGPACTAWRELGTGRHVVGRAAQASLRIDDPDVAPHQGYLDVGADGTVTFHQVTGRIPARLDGVPCSSRTAVQPGQWLHVGASVLAVRPLGGAGPVAGAGGLRRIAGDPWRLVVDRAVPPHADDVTPLVAPRPPDVSPMPAALGLVGATVAAGAAGVLAVAMGQSMLAVFALIGALASAATWVAAAGAAGVRRIRHRRRHRRELDEFAAALDDAHTALGRRLRRDCPDVTTLLDLVERERAAVWSWRERESLEVSVGLGTVRRTMPVERADGRVTPEVDGLIDAAEAHERMAVPVSLLHGTAVALHGPEAPVAALARSLIVQLAVSRGPADVRLVVLTDERSKWEWVGWLPHTVEVASPSAAADLLGAGAGVAASPRVVVTDAPDALSVRTSGLRRALAAGTVSCIVLVAGDRTVPAACATVVEVSSTGMVRFGSGERALLSGVSPTTAARVARSLAGLVDPEAATEGRSLREVGLDALGVDADPDAIAARWSAAGPDPPLVAPLGLAGDGVVELDLVADGPHALVGGTTGSGKSELLRTLVAGLAHGASPAHVNFVLVDFKGGAAFDACSRLPHTVGVVTDLDEGLAARALVSLDAEIRRREHLLRDAGVDGLAAFRRARPDPLPRLVVIVDEFAGLARELPDFLSSLVGIAQRGRSLGIHLVLATQRPAGVVTDDIRANTNIRIALRVNDRAEAVDLVDDALAASFPRSAPGRAVLRLAGDPPVVFQTASCTRPRLPRRGRLHLEYGAGVEATAVGMPLLPELVDAIGRAAATAGPSGVHRPWLDPLPPVLDVAAGSLDDGAVGVVDDPAHQCRHPLRWDPDAGNVLLTGPLGSGTTTAAIALVAATVSTHPAGACDVYVIDGRGDARWDDVAGAPWCGAVVGVGEPERLARLLARLADALDDPVGRPPARTVVVVDGFAAARNAVDDLDTGASAALFERLVRDGPGRRVSWCVVADGPGATVPNMAAAAHWSFGSPPGRVHVVETGLDAQVGWGIAPVAAEPAARHPPPIDVLPPTVSAGDLDRAQRAAPAGGGAEGLAVGLEAADHAVARLVVPPGDHVLVVGPARSGVSTALARVAASWTQAHPAGIVVTADASSPLDSGAVRDAMSRPAPVLVLVDDADRVDDPEQVLAGVARSRPPGVTIVAGARHAAARAAYGHWLRDVARSRCGLILTSPDDHDGELLGALLPRRPWVPPRPGLAWLVDGRGHRLVQVATPDQPAARARRR